MQIDLTRFDKYLEEQLAYPPFKREYDRVEIDFGSFDQAVEELEEMTARINAENHRARAILRKLNPRTGLEDRVL